MLRIGAKTIDDGTAASRYWEPNTARNRAVPISSTLRRYLERYPRRIVPGGWLFQSPAGTRWDPDNFCRDLADLDCSAGLHWSYLDYRHTFGSPWAMKGESLYKISTLLAMEQTSHWHRADGTPRHIRVLICWCGIGIDRSLGI